MDDKRCQELLTLLVPFGTACMVPMDRAQLNKDDAGDARFLLALFLLGAADFVHQAEKLTYGEFQHLALEMLSKLGWSFEAASAIFDVAADLPRWGQKRLEYAEEAMMAGADAFRDFYLKKDTMAPLDAGRLYVKKWKGVDLGD